MRTEHIKNYLASGMFAVCPRYLEGIVATVNTGEVAKIETFDTVSPSHSYEKIGDLAIITVDGAMTKKNTWMNAMCGNLVPYDAISSYIDKAEQDPEVAKILFNVDTVGGEVYGVDNLGEKIYSSKKETITYYNNIGASAGIWAFSAAKKIYANKTAVLGSIGVMSGYMEKDGEDKKVVLVSKNAKNKNCSLTGDCKTRIESSINELESIFLSRVARNTGMSQDDIVSKFGEGDVISADKAKEIGFIEDILSYDEMLSTLATAASSVKNSKNFTKGVSMGAELNAEALQAKLEAEATLHAKTKEELAAAVATMAMDKSTIDGLKAQIEATKNIVAMAFEHGVDKTAAMSMVETGSVEKAALIALEAKKSTASVTATQDITSETQGSTVPAEALAAFAKTLKFS